MASINDVFNAVNKVNTTLWTLISDEITATNNVKTSVDKLDVDVNNGFNGTQAQLKTIAQIDVVIAQLLFHLTQQTDTMICALQQISQNTCGILTQTTLQTALQERLAHDADIILKIEETAHPEASMEVHRFAAIKAQVEKCCPPAVVPPACTYQACPAPKPIAMPQLPQTGETSTNPK